MQKEAGVGKELMHVKLKKLNKNSILTISPSPFCVVILLYETPLIGSFDGINCSRWRRK